MAPYAYFVYPRYSSVTLYKSPKESAAEESE